MTEIQDPNDVFVRVCEADLIRIPEFLQILTEDYGLGKIDCPFAIDKFEGNETIVMSDDARTIWIGRDGYDLKGVNYRIKGELPLAAIQQFMVGYMDTNPDTVAERLSQGEAKVFKQRTLDKYIVDCERYVSYHKSFIPTEKNLARHQAFISETATGQHWNEDAIANNLGGTE